MRYKNSIQFKALILLVVFSLNTVVGFACALGMDMGFNTQHHENANADAITHQHEEGTPPHYHDKTSGSHHENHEQQPKGKFDSKDNCCNDEVIKFAQVDKSVSPSLSIGINPVFFTVFISSFYNVDFLFKVTPNIKHFVRSYHPPISDIRIAIQSFQI